MTKDEIIDMAEICSVKAKNQDEFMELFAKLVAQNEREACAKLCEETTASWTQHLYNEGCIDCAKAIRAKDKHD
jgi:hypothetical protein